MNLTNKATELKQLEAVLPQKQFNNLNTGRVIEIAEIQSSIE